MDSRSEPPEEPRIQFQECNDPQVEQRVLQRRDSSKWDTFFRESAAESYIQGQLEITRSRSQKLRELTVYINMK